MRERGRFETFGSKNPISCKALTLNQLITVVNQHINVLFEINSERSIKSAWI